MLPTFEPIHLIYLSIAIALEVVANVLMKLSQGFEQKLYGFSAIICVLAAFTALSFAVAGIQLSVAYAIWGGVGLIATAIIGVIMFDQRLHLSAWLGICLIMIGVVLMKMS